MRKRAIILLLLAISISFGWQRLWEFGHNHTPNEFFELSDSTFILVGRVQQTYVSPEIKVIRFDADGDTIWLNSYGDVDRFNYGLAGIQISDTSFVYTASYNTDIILMECLNFDGESIWHTMYEPLADMEYYFYGIDLEIDRDGSIISNCSDDFVNFNLDGDVLRRRHFIASSYDITYRDMKVVNVEPYGYVICGQYFAREEDEYWGIIAYYDTLGNTNWEITCGETNGDELYDIEVINNPAPGSPPGFIAVGKTRGDDDIGPAFIVRTDLDGNVLWVNRFKHPDINPITGGRVRAGDVVWAGNETYQTRFAVVGNMRIYSDPDDSVRGWMTLVSDTLDGDTLWTRSFDYYPELYPNNIVKCLNGDYLIVGRKGTSSTVLPFWLCRVDSLGNDVPYAIEEPHVSATPLPEQLEITVWPNPFNSSCQIDIPEGFTAEIYDIRGGYVQTLPAGSSVWDAENQASGVYLVRAFRGDESIEKKVVLIR